MLSNRVVRVKGDGDTEVGHVVAEGIAKIQQEQGIDPEFPAEVEEAAARRAPHRIATYALELARAWAAFYRDCHVLRAETDDLKSFRIGLCVATRRTLARSLDLLGVSAPDSM
jgi:hypothetical protein